jgi:4-coumarate--CoA ligase
LSLHKLFCFAKYDLPLYLYNVLTPHLLLKHPLAKKYSIASHVRCITFGAAPLSYETHSHLLSLFPNAHIGQGYGMTETSNVVTLFPMSQKHGTPGTAGRLVPGCEAKIVKADGTLGGYEEAGELYVKTPAAPLGYVRNEKA